MFCLLCYNLSNYLSLESNMTIDYNTQQKNIALVEIEIWQGLIVTSVVFLLATAMLLFGALLPQTKVNALISNNAVKTVLYSDYINSLSDEIDDAIGYTSEQTDCSRKSELVFESRKNEQLDTNITKRLDYSKNIQPETTEFTRLTTSATQYFQSQKDLLDLQNSTGEDMVKILNLVQSMCDQTNEEVLASIAKIHFILDKWETSQLNINKEWIAQFDLFVIQFSAEDGYNPSEKFATTMEADQELKKIYYSLSTISVDFSQQIEQLTEDRAMFMEVLHAYEDIEYSLHKELHNQQKEVLFYTIET
jgi:hypothetical protein